MNMQTFFQTMSDGFEVAVTRWIPDGQVKGIVQLAHGMVEHVMRYDRFGSILAENGWLLNAHDMRGHGRTAEHSLENGTGSFGYLADKNGFARVTDDVREVIQKVRADFPGKKLVLFGHSFGSFVSQNFIEEYANYIDACILMGTAGPRLPLVFFGKLLASLIALFRGKKYVSPLLEKIAFGAYTKKIPDAQNGHAWLSRDTFSVDMYVQDKWCGFNPSAQFYCDMMTGLFKIHQSKNIKKIPHELPVFIMYGNADPVGDYGKTVQELCVAYRKNGMTNVVVKEYDGARHELLHETNKDEVEDDIVSYLNALL